MRTGTSYFKTLSTMMWFMALLLVVFTVGCDRDHGAAAPPAPLAPTVTLTVPANSDTNVQINRRITATFSEVMAPATITTASFIVTGPGATITTAITGSVTYAGETAVFTPSSALAANSLYNAKITAVVTSQAGIAMAVDFPWSFTTGGTADIIAPTLISTGTFSGATGLPINRDATATFSEPMNPATLASPATNFTLKEFLSGNTVTGVVTYLGNTATFNPDSDLLPNTKYEAEITTGATDLAIPANALAPGLLPNPWSWTTGNAADIAAPTVTFTSPVDIATSVPVNSRITATFSEAMRPTTITTANFIVTKASETVLVLGTVVYDTLANTATFLPSDPLASSTTYNALITTGALDLAGNALASGVVPNPWSFTTAALIGAPPSVISTTPADIASSVCIGINQSITATFSKDMLASTITSIGTFTVKETFGSALTGTVTYNALTKIATFATATLTTGTHYTATITTAATDLAGIPLAANKVWSFTAGSAICAPAVNLGLAAPFGIASAAGVTNDLATNPPNTTINGDVILDDLGGATANEGAICNSVFVDNAGGFGLCGGIAPIINGTVISPSFPDAGITSGAIKAALNAAYLSIIPGNLPGATVLGCGIIGTGSGAGAGPGCVSNNNATLPPGVYISATATTIGVTGVLTLDGQGDANARFIFQAGSTLTTAAGAPGLPGSEIRLINGAKASNVWWQVGSSATIGTFALFQGNVLANTSITMGDQSTSCGRLLAGAITTTGAFTFDGNVVSVPGHPNAPVGCQ